MDVDEVESENRSVLAFASGRVTAGGHAVHGDPIGRQREQRMPRLDAAARPPPAVARDAVEGTKRSLNTRRTAASAAPLANEWSLIVRITMLRL